MKKKNSALVTVIVTLVLLILAAFVFVQPYLNSTPYTTDENIASFLGVAFGKYPRFITEEDFNKVEVLEIGTSDGFQYISLAFDGFVEKRDDYIKAYDNATAEGLEAPEIPDFSKDLANYETDGNVKGFVNLENFKNLVEVNIMTDVYPVSANLQEFKNAASLKALNITGSTSEDAVKINDISVLGDKTALTSVSLVGNDISDISALANLTNLETLALDSNNISDISALNAKDKITTLSLTANKISDISPVASMTALKSLYMDENEIEDISVLSGMENIVNVSLSKNKIVDVSPVSAMKNASVISLSNNAIVDVSPLAALADVTAQMYILLSENAGITDWTALDALPSNIMIIGKPDTQTTEETTTDDTVIPSDETAVEENTETETNEN